jgi:hypothetical protein
MLPAIYCCTDPSVYRGQQAIADGGRWWNRLANALTADSIARAECRRDGDRKNKNRKHDRAPAAPLHAAR